MALRISIVLILLISILYLPFWLSLIIAISAMAYFSFFWEAVLLFFISDLIYGAQEAKFSYEIYISLLISITSLLMIEIIKNKLRLEKK